MAEQQASGRCPEVLQPVFLNIAEAAGLWRGITGEDVTPVVYEGRCASGELQSKGVSVTLAAGGKWLTDMDSLLAYLDCTITEQYRLIKEALEERRAEIEGF